MKMRLVVLTILVATLALPAALYAQETDPAAVVKARIEVLNADDADAAADYSADDATYRITDSPPGVPDTFTGKEEIRGRLADLVALNSSVEIEIRQVEGDKDTALTKFSDDPLREMGIDFIEGIEEYTVVDGKITSYLWTMTEESLAKVMAAETSPEDLPETGDYILPTRVLALALGSLAFLGGLGIALLRRRSPRLR